MGKQCLEWNLGIMMTKQLNLRVETNNTFWHLWAAIQMLIVAKAKPTDVHHHKCQKHAVNVVSICAAV